MTEPDPRHLERLAAFLRTNGRVSDELALELAGLLLGAGYSPPQPGVRPLPPFVFAGHVGRRPPWSWFNLTEEERDELEAVLEEFVEDYNANLARSDFDLIPPCWREHRPVVMALPVFFFAFWAATRAGDASPAAAMDFYQRTLWAWQERLPTLLGPHAASCRGGNHKEDGELADAQALLGVDHKPARFTWFGMAP